MPWSEAARRSVARARAERAARPEAVLARRRNKALRQKQWSARNRDVVKEINWRHKLKRVYGITPADFDAMLARQNGLCAICERPIRRDRDTHIDHCPTSGKVRGLLCSTCNPLLGFAQEDVSLLRRAADYLAAHTE